MLKVNYMPKCCGESGPRALIRTWLRFTFKAFPPLFFFFFNSSALSSVIGMQMFPFIAGRGLCHCSEGTQTSRLVQWAGRNPPEGFQALWEIMMYETGIPLEPEGNMTDRIIWEENIVFTIETDGLILSPCYCYQSRLR